MGPAHRPGEASSAEPPRRHASGRWRSCAVRSSQLPGRRVRWATRPMPKWSAIPLGMGKVSVADVRLGIWVDRVSRHTINGIELLTIIDLWCINVANSRGECHCELPQLWFAFSGFREQPETRKALEWTCRGARYPWRFATKPLRQFCMVGRVCDVLDRNGVPALRASREAWVSPRCSYRRCWPEDQRSRSHWAVRRDSQANVAMGHRS